MATWKTASELGREERSSAVRSFFAACKEGDAKTFEKILKKYPYLLCKADGYCRLAIEIAAGKGDMKIVEICVKYGAGRPLERWVSQISQECIKPYKEGDPCPGTYHPYYPCTGVCRALTHAATNGRIDLVKYLLKKGANPNHVDRWSPFEDSNDGTPFEEALMAGQTECVKLLVAAGANFDFRACKALRRCCYMGHLETVKHIFAAFPDKTRYERSEFTAPVIESGNLDLVKTFIEWYPREEHKNLLSECKKIARENRKSVILDYLLTLSGPNEN